ncbi:MAG: aspartate carbamoyltransferase [Candidatus Micrarchaeota archaeon]|nr:aspartate carbamoyltransferase [Candidatus Micrarchaeota archaeon]
MFEPLGSEGMDNADTRAQPSRLYSKPRWDKKWEKYRSAGWDWYSKLKVEDKLPLFSKDGRIYDVLFAQQFDRDLLDHLCKVADKLRIITKSREGDRFVADLLFDKRAILVFNQPSSRTFLSFQNACHILGMKTSEIRDISTSSFAKGESPLDSIRTFASYVHLMIMRMKEDGFVEKAAWHLNAETNRPIPIINAGSGTDQHPTQALLDIYTMSRLLEGGIDGKHIVMVGDLKRGRTVRSLSYLMKNYKDVRITFVSPEEFRMSLDILQFLREHGIRYTETYDFESAIRDADVIYMTRIQDEYDKDGESKRVDYSRYHFQPKHLQMIKPSCIIMHPLPRRDEIHTDVDKDPRAVYWRQERNGMWVRAALISYIFRVDSVIMEFKTNG